MYAWKCDICGSLYEEADVNSPDNKIDPFTGDEINFFRREVVIRDYEMIRVRANYNSITRPSLPPYRAHEVCPECMKKIEDFCKLIRLTKGDKT